MAHGHVGDLLLSREEGKNFFEASYDTMSRCNRPILTRLPVCHGTERAQLIRELEKARRFKENLRKGQACLGAQIALSDPVVAEIFGRAGFDWLVLDTEHSAQSTLTARAMLQACVASEAVLLVRPLRLDPDDIRRFLDLGSPGVLCPFVNSGRDAKLLVDACRYPPAGIRGWAPRRAGGYGFDSTEYATAANDAMICIPVIESREGVENIDDIVAVDGIDGVTIGPMDLSISLNCFQQFDHPDYLEAVRRVREACQRHGKAMGAGCYSNEHAQQCIREGDVLLLVAGDDLFLAGEAKRQIGLLRNLEGASPR
jgi:2-keto-3-deoxy-L-rhamnonate aldolase RhmA